MNEEIEIDTIYIGEEAWKECPICLSSVISALETGYSLEGACGKGSVS
jgi:hypothetical protein